VFQSVYLAAREYASRIGIGTEGFRESV
jgi:hypothetical protein